MQYEIDEKLEEILKKYKSKITINGEYYLYNGNNIKKENKFERIVNYADEKNKSIIELKEIICPECNENVILKINDYKLEMKCINNHDNILLLKDYNNKIGISKIKCNKCNKNKNDVDNNEFYICLKCNINLCPICKSSHDKNHNIINYDDKNYICNKHNENYNKYCCNKNICNECENEHKNHKSINYGDILPNINDEIKEYIDKLKNEIEDIKNKLNNIMEYIDIYYNIYTNIINNYKKNKKNYESIQNINEFNDYNKIITKDIVQIIKEKDINNKFKRIMNIFNKINTNNSNNYIIGEFEIKESNKEIRIINSYEQYMREAKMEIEDNYKNEEEIKDNLEIIINGKNIPFTYFYKFEEIGNYKIKYAFKKNLTKTGFMFSQCSSLINIDLSNFNTQNVTFMGYMFGGCSSLNNINLNNFNTQNVIEMWCMFRECKSLKNLDLSNFNTQNVNNMNFMFFGCSSLQGLDLSNFNIQNVTTMVNMFNGCSSLINLNLSNLDTKNVKNMSNIFNGCSSLEKNNVLTNDDKILKKLK